MNDGFIPELDDDAFDGCSNALMRLHLNRLPHT